jgi:hypothetical protein
LPRYRCEGNEKFQNPPQRSKIEVALVKKYGYSKEKKAAWRRKYQTSAKGRADKLKYRLQRRYGLSVQEFERMLAQQNGVCAICREPESKKRNGVFALSVDHCHLTGRVRALLCGRCNSAIGYLRESPLLARAAATYLEQQLTKEFTGE